MKRNDAPVGLELPPDWRTMDVQPPARKPPLKRESTIDDTQIFSLNSGVQAPIDKMTEDTCNHSRGSSESHTVLFTDLHKPPLESHDGGENTRGCNVSPTALQSQVDTTVISGDGTEIQVDEKVESKEIGKLLVQDESVTPNEQIVDMETECAALQNVEQNKEKGTEMSELMSKTAEESSSELQNVKPDEFERALPHLTNYFENTNELEKILDFKEIPKPVSKVISIAEILRAQLKALDSTLINSVPTIEVQADFVHKPTTTGTETCQQLKEDVRKCDPEVKKSMPDRKMEKITDDTAPTNIKATLMEIYHQLNTDSTPEQIQTQGATSPPVQALQKPLVIPPVSDLETTGLNAGAKKCNVNIMDVGKETEASTSTDELTVNRRSGAPTKASSQTSNIVVLEHAEDQPVQCKNIELVQKLTPEIKLNSKTESGISEMNSTTPLDQCKMEEHNVNSSSLQSGQTFPTKSVEEKNQLLQQDSSIVEEFSTNQTPEVSPLLKKRNCVSPIPSATPQELASGARRKILIPKTKPEEATEATSPVENQTQNSKLSTSPVSLSTSPSVSRRSPLLQPPGERTSPVERLSPLVSRRKMALETQAPNQQPTEEVHTPKTEGKPAEKNKHDPFKGKTAIKYPYD